MTIYHFDKDTEQAELAFCDMEQWAVTPRFIQRNTKAWVNYHGLNQNVLSFAYDDQSIHDVHISRQKR